MFATASFALWLLFISRPPLKSGITPDLHFPRSVSDLRVLADVSSAYQRDHYSYILALFSAAYVYKQTFAIPGSALLNLLGGALLGCWPLGLPLCCLLTAIGASNCFLLSHLAGRDLVVSKFSSTIERLREKLGDNKQQMFVYLVSVRVFPMTPNWLLNITAPLLDVPLSLFFLSVLIGLVPYNLVCVQAGEMLSEVRSLDDVLTPRRILALLTLALAVLTLSHFTQKAKNKHSD
ncbi:hypothetical protein Pmani_005617 [Petrolisthes manimaculis]|uniref:VTT domain-containing protein n=1 Tax=Petrolisthes manimaculis TaxID=1843537 RepID=A0AAE1QDE8_9EUCA|nr:hypothetical protein Pmani_005617 [Petrolisthes manimaculis]